VPLFFDLARLGHVGWLRDHEIDLQVDWFEMCSEGNREIYRGSLDWARPFEAIPRENGVKSRAFRVP
jgi:hypothetical protein